MTERLAAVRAISALGCRERCELTLTHDHNGGLHSNNGRVPSAKADDRTLTGPTLRRGDVDDEWRTGRLRTPNVVVRGRGEARSPQRLCCCLRSAAAAHDVDHVEYYIYIYILYTPKTIARRVRVRVSVRVRIPESLLRARTGLNERAWYTDAGHDGRRPL